MAIPDATNQFGEPANIEGRFQWVAGRLLTAASAFFFLAFLFAYVYLKTINANGMFHPSSVKPSSTFGIVVLALVLASAVVSQVALARLRSRGVRSWRGPAMVALALGLAAIVVQIVQLSNVGFGWGDSGFASVFVGWAFWFTVIAASAMYQLEAIVARASRSQVDPWIEPAAESFQFFWWQLTGVALLAFILLYVVG